MPFHSVDFGSKRVNFRLQFSERKTLGISVLPDTTVLVTAPSRYADDLDRIKSRIIKRAPWILKQQSAFAKYVPKQPARRFISGESYRYLGRQLRLKVIEGRPDRVRVMNGRLELTVSDKADKVIIEKRIRTWYNDRARLLFGKKLEDIAARLVRYGIVSPGFKLRRMTMRWGSCGKSGPIYLNPELVKYSSSCIEYVIAHELCHLVHPNHDKKFYGLLKRVMPDWEIRKTRLERSAGA